MSRYHDLAANAKRRPVDQAEANVYPGARASRSQLVPHRFGQMDLFELDDLVLGGRIAGRKGVQSVSQQACLGSAGPSPLRLERWQWPCRSRRRSWADGQKTKQMSAQPKKGVLSWIPLEMHSTFTGVHRAFSYGNRERSKCIGIHRDGMTRGISAGTTARTSKPGRMFTGVHRAFSHGYHSKCIGIHRAFSHGSTERSLMDTIRDAIEFIVMV